jgi:hypothetical protein
MSKTLIITEMGSNKVIYSSVFEDSVVHEMHALGENPYIKIDDNSGMHYMFLKRGWWVSFRPTESIGA